MSSTSRFLRASCFVELLPTHVRDRLLADCTLVTLGYASVLHEPGAVVRHIHFPITSFISLLKTVDEHSTIEVGMIGSEGLCGNESNAARDVATLRALVQGAGTAWRIGLPAFRQHCEQSPELRELLDRYASFLMRQLAQTIACTRFHVVEQRLARWLLMTRDRARSDAFAVTQEFLAHMLGVRRAGVTNAASALQQQGLIAYRRGDLAVLDVDGLVAAACTCYRADRDAYRNHMKAQA